MIQYRVLWGATTDEIEGKVETALNNERENWKLHGGPVVFNNQSHYGLPFVYFQAVVQEVNEQEEQKQSFWREKVSHL